MVENENITFRLHKRQGEVLLSEANEILYGGAAGGGKALWIDTPILTPCGFAAMKDIHPGDTVFDENGNPCSVIAETPIMTGHRCFRVVFDDGSEIIADAGHLWKTMTAAERIAAQRRTPQYRQTRRNTRKTSGMGKRDDLADMNHNRDYDLLLPPAGEIRTTEEISRTLRERRGRLNHSVAVAKAVNIPANPDEHILPIPPYTLGAWLGNGNADGAGFTTADSETIDNIRRDGFCVTKRTAKYAYGIIGLQTLLRTSGLLGNKHVPDVYLFSSADTRMALLHGLMDTDGTIDDRGHCEFCSMNRNLADAVAFLVNSFGVKSTVTTGRAMLNGKDCGEKYRVQFIPHFPVFRLSRKAGKIRNTITKFAGRRIIVAVEEIESRPVKCIQVGAPSGMYLAGKNLIPTHNSHLMRVLAIMCCLYVPGLLVYLFRRYSGDLIQNHFNGPTGFPELLAPFIADGYCKISYSPHACITFWNGAKIMACHCQYEKDAERFRGAEIHLLLIDELTLFSETIYRFLRARCRASDVFA